MSSLLLCDVMVYLSELQDIKCCSYLFVIFLICFIELCVNFNFGSSSVIVKEREYKLNICALLIWISFVTGYG